MVFALCNARSTRMKTTISSLLGIGFCLATMASAQPGEIPPGTNISVRTNETIDVRQAGGGRIYYGSVDRDVRDASGNVAIPRGAEAELMVREVGARDRALDLESVTVNGRRYSVRREEVVGETGREQRQGVGKNERTAKYVGGGALLGTIVGAIAGGGKGAAIGAIAGGAAGAGAQTYTRGERVMVPAESIVTFRLGQALYIDMADRGYMREGHHYHYQDQQYPER
jgi:hypothetical protein